MKNVIWIGLAVVVVFAVIKSGNKKPEDLTSAHLNMDVERILIGLKLQGTAIERKKLMESLKCCKFRNGFWSAIAA